MAEYSQQINDAPMHASARMMTGFVMGALVGAGIALLLAPATGEDTRRRLGETARRLRHRAEDQLGRVRDRFRGDEEGDETTAVNEQTQGVGMGNRPV